MKKEFDKKDVVQQVYRKFDDGTKTIFDDVVVDQKKLKAELTNETKTGAAKSSTQQQRYQDGETVTLMGKKAETAGIAGQKINVSNTPHRNSKVDVQTKQVQTNVVKN